MNPKQCFENWGQETSTCSRPENSLVLLERTGFMTKSSNNAFVWYCWNCWYYPPPGFGASFWMMRDLRFGQRTAISLRSNPLHWILSPLSCEPTSSRQWTMFSTMMFSRVRKASLGQWRNTPGFRDRGLLLPRNIVSRLGQQLAETNKNKFIFSIMTQMDKRGFVL